jgi:tRNA (guanine-N7-)-methyltransferase
MIALIPNQGCSSRVIRSYVIRRARFTKGQRRAFAQGWEKFGLDMRSGRLNTELEFGKLAPLIVEIGFGMGDSLFEMAQKNPESHFIGIEVYAPGVGRLINRAHSAGLTNLRIYFSDAKDVLESCIALESIDRLQLYFPDPWHKKKHHKRRLVQLGFVELVRSRLRLGGIFHMATDWKPYAEHMLNVMNLSEGFENCGNGMGGYSSKPKYRPVTKFEERGRELGHGVWDLLFSRQI